MTVHIVHFFRPINEATCNGMMQACLQAIKQGASELHLHMSSTGGATVYGFTMCNFLRSLPINVTAHNMGTVESMAVPVFLTASTRTADPNSRFAMHPLIWEVTAATEIPHVKMREWVASLDNDVQRYVDFFEQATQGAKQPFDIRKALAGDTSALVAATGAVEAGIAHVVTSVAMPPDAITWWV